MQLLRIQWPAELGNLLEGLQAAGGTCRIPSRQLAAGVDAASVTLHDAGRSRGVRLLPEVVAGLEALGREATRDLGIGRDFRLLAAGGSRRDRNQHGERGDGRGVDEANGLHDFSPVFATRTMRIAMKLGRTCPIERPRYCNVRSSNWACLLEKLQT